jgi:TRAP-type C4-dicarboxylate transport system permease small subunit
MIGKSLAVAQESLAVVIKIMTWLAIAALSGLALILVGNVVSRALFNAPILGTVEIAELLTLVVVFLTIAYTEKEKGHVNIDLLLPKLPRNFRAASTVVLLLLSVIYFLLLAWQGVSMMLSNIHPYLTSPILDIPFYPFMLIIALGSFLVSLQTLLNLLQERMMKGISKESRRTEA